MEKFTEIVRHLIENFRSQFDNQGEISRKKWFTYGGLLIISAILFLSVGGSKPTSSVVMPAGDTEMLIGDTYLEMSGRLVGMGEPDQSMVDWEKIPEGLEPVYQTWGRDPFADQYRYGPTEILTIKSELLLSAISWRGDDAIVLINDSILKEGDVVDGAKVMEISTNSVTLLRNDRQIVLDLSGDG